MPMAATYATQASAAPAANVQRGQLIITRPPRLAGMAGQYVRNPIVVITRYERPPACYHTKRAPWRSGSASRRPSHMLHLVSGRRCTTRPRVSSPLHCALLLLLAHPRRDCNTCDSPISSSEPDAKLGAGSAKAALVSHIAASTMPPRTDRPCQGYADQYCSVALADVM